MRNKESSGRAKVKVRLVEFEMEGGDDTLAESVRNLVHALRTPTRQLPAAAPLPPANGDGPAEEPALGEEVVLEATGNEDPLTTSNTTSNRRKPPAPPKAELVQGLDLSARPTPFRDFCDAYNLDSKTAKHTSRYLVLAAWLKEHRNITSMTMNYAYTAYKFMSWNMPRSFEQPLHDMARKQSWFRPDAAGGYELTTIGEEQVRQMRR